MVAACPPSVWPKMAVAVRAFLKNWGQIPIVPIVFCRTSANLVPGRHHLLDAMTHFGRLPSVPQVFLGLQRQPMARVRSECFQQSPIHVCGHAGMCIFALAKGWAGIQTGGHTWRSVGLRLKLCAAAPIHFCQVVTKGWARMFKRVVSLGSLLWLAGCASVLNESQQPIDVVASCNGMSMPAQCVAENAMGRWRFTAPAQIMVTRDRSALRVSCNLPFLGAQSAIARPGLQGAMAGNLLLGGLVGGAVDVATARGFQYPDEINLVYPSCKQ